MTEVRNSVAAALAHAVTNERYGPGGIVSRNDAKKILSAAIKEIADSENPAEDFAYNSRFFAAAKTMLGSSADAARILESYTQKGTDAVNARLAALGEDLELPGAAKVAVADMIGWRVDPADVKLTNEKNTNGGYEFSWEHEGETGTGFVAEFAGAWIASPIVFDPAILPDVLDAAIAHFDAVVVPWASDYNDEDELDEYRDEIRITGLSVNENPDDWDKTDEGFEEGFPYEFNIDGGAPGDGGLYVAFNPSTGELNGFGRWA